MWWIQAWSAERLPVSVLTMQTQTALGKAPRDHLLAPGGEAGVAFHRLRCIGDQIRRREGGVMSVHAGGRTTKSVLCGEPGL